MKKILFSLFVIFSLFFINNNVHAATLQDDLYLSQDYYYELSDYIEDNYGTGLMGDTGERCQQIWITHVYYAPDYMKKTYYVIQYEEILSSYIVDTDKDTWDLRVNNYVEIVIEEYYKNGILDERRYTKEFTNSGTGFPHNNQLLLKYLDNYSTSWGAYHIALSYDALTIYSTDDTKYLFYNPGYNFEKNITADTLKTNPDQAYDDFYSDINDQNKNIFERIWGGIVNIFNAIVSIPQKIVDFIRELFEDIVGGLALVDKDLLNQFLDELNNQLKNNFGFIYDVFDIIFDILNRFINISSGSHIINIPEIKEPISGGVIINSYSFNFDEVLNKYNIVFLHELYLSFVDVWVLIALINFGRKQYFRMFGGNL